MIFRELVKLAKSLESTSGRLDKVNKLAMALKKMEPREAAIAVRLLTGRLFPEYSEKKLGVGWSLLATARRSVEGSSPFFKRQLTIGEVYATLEKIAEASGEDSRRKKLRLLQSLFANMERDEAEYLTRFLLGEPRLGAHEGLVLEALAKATGVKLEALRRAYMFMGDLGDLAEAVLKGVKPESVTLQLFRPVKSMLAEMAYDLRSALKECGGVAAFEYKYDGVRLQVHRKGSKVKLFTRRLSDVTESLPDVVDLVMEYVKADEVVLDCEGISFKDGKPLRFQDLVKRVRRKEGVERMVEEMPFEIRVFDVLYLDGQVLVDLPYKERWEILQRIASEEILIERIVTDDLQEARKFYNESLESGNEGVMVKRLTSPYTPGARGKHWFKVKPAETLDVVILGAEWGHGRRKGWLSDYYLAVLDDETGDYLVVGKTFKGLTDTEFEEVTRKLLELKIRDEGWRVWVKPAIVVEVAFSEIQRSPKYRSGYALRFARIVRFRPDKSPREIATIKDLKKMYEVQFKRKSRASL